MKLLIHDLDKENANERIQIDNNTVVIGDDGQIKQCIGCFGCWVKTPGSCVLKDEYCNMAKKLASCDEIQIISRCTYGCYSPFIRNILDRSLPYLLPYFTNINGTMHHKPRYKGHKLSVSVYFYGENISENERQTATELVKANAVNMYAEVKNITFTQAPIARQNDSIEEAV